MTPSIFSYKGFLESLPLLEDSLVRTGLLPPARQSTSTPLDARSILSQLQEGSRMLLTRKKPLIENSAFTTPMWKLARFEPRPLKRSAMQRTGLVRHLAGTRRSTPKPPLSAALPTARTSVPIGSLPSAGQEPYTHIVAAAPVDRMWLDALSEPDVAGARRSRGRFLP